MEKTTENFPRPFNNDYELLGVLGKGGMGSNVYKARQNKLDRVVALKVLDRGHDNEAEKRFYSEAQAMRELNHQNLVSVYDFGMQDDKIFIAMTFVDGESLSDMLRKEKKLPVKNAIYIAWQIAKGLEYAHERKIIHRDIKPSNIMIKKNFDVCIIDFGISITNESLRLTGTGMTMGTPEYMSPEQCQNKNLTQQSDIYNLGILFYEMLSGDPPFTGAAALAILNKHLNEKPVPLRKKNPEVLPNLERVIDKCLEKKMEDRYESFSDFIEDIKQLNVDTQRETTSATIGTNLTKHERSIFLILCALPILSIMLSILLILKPAKVSEAPVVAMSNLIPKIQTVQSFPPEISVKPVLDGDLSTAWIIPKASALNANSGVFITIRFAEPTLVTHLGMAIGSQSDFQKYNKPKDVLIHWTNTSVKEGEVRQSDKQSVSFKDKPGVQYPGWIPVEVTELMFELKKFQDDKKTDDMAISEIRIFGIETGGAGQR